MDARRWQKVEELFQAALEREPKQRAAFLAGVCGDDEALCSEVESLIAHHEKASVIVDTPAVEEALRLVIDNRNDLSAGHPVGPYRIIREIGRGGMGAVYLASRDDDQYQKRVAIKVVRQGFDDQFLVSRFLNERQILANLEHKNIARLLEGGATDEGSPYLVMEYIEGAPIDRYCDEHKLSTVERLKLFRIVCSAVQYAHQHLVIHRDIKPSNILVTEEGTPKLLDFGIAKILSPESAPQTTDQTATAVRLMTPDYASPEQVRGQSVTTLTDIYSLGVLLYRLLTGHHPYRFKTPSPQEIERVICEQEPERPSTAISRIEEITTSDGMATKITPEMVSNTRDTEAGKLRRLLGGDLDNIVLMAMRKEPHRRYASVAELSEDIRRHFEWLPVVARKDTLSYRGARLIARHKLAVTAAALVALAIIAGIVATLWQARVAAREARVATEQRDKARLETAKAERINAFLQSIVSYADPSWYSPGRGRGRDLKVVDALNEAAQRIDTEMSDQPEVRAELHHTIGNTYRALGVFDNAEKHFRAALSLYRELYGEQHPKVAENLYYLGAAIVSKGDYASAESTYRQAISLMRSVDGDNVNLPYMLQDLGGTLVGNGNTTEAEPILNEALELFRKRYGEDHITVATTYGHLGLVYDARGEMNKAEAMYQESIERQRQLPGYETPAQTLVILGRLYINVGKYAAAEASLREALDSSRKIYGDYHPHIANALCYLSRLHYLEHDFANAETEIRRALDIQRRLMPEQVIGSVSFLCEILIKSGKLDRGKDCLREAMASYKKALAEHKQDPVVTGLLGGSLVLLKRYGEAEPLLIDSYNDLKASQGEQNPKTVEALGRLISLYEGWKKPDHGEQYRALLVSPKQ